MKKHFFFRNIIFLSVIIVLTAFQSCSNEEDVIESDPKSSFLLPIADPEMDMLEEYSIISENEIDSLISRSNSNGNSILTRGTTPLEINFTATGYNGTLEKGRAEVVLIASDIASQVGIKTGNYAVITFKANKVVLWDQKSNLPLVGFSPKPSTETGFINPIAVNGYATIKDNSRSYNARTEYVNGKPNSYVMTSNFMYISTRIDNVKVEKWYPCNPLQAKWNFGAIVLY